MNHEKPVYESPGNARGDFPVRSADATLRLFLYSAVFMFLFQLESRLVGYIYMFHEGVVLVESSLLGSGIVLLAAWALPQALRRRIREGLPFAIPALFFVQIPILFRYHDFAADCLLLSLLFGMIFLKISSFLFLPPNRFYAADLGGAFFGIVCYLAGVTRTTEEILILATIIILLLITAPSGKRSWKTGIAFGGLCVFGLSLAVRIAGEDLVTLVRAHPGSRSFKAHAIDERWGARPFRSYSHLKGRTDVYRFPRGRLALVFRNMGYFVGHTTRPEYLKRDPVVYLEPRIPRLDYRPESRVLSIGSAAGGYTQAFRKYIPDARITGVEIDGSFREICRDPAIAPFVPDLSSYELVFEDGRRFAETTGKRFDVVCASIDSINSLEPDYADERTSMLVTREAFSAYFRILEPGGYLLVEQFYPRTRGGEAMVLKMLKTLAAASGDSPEVLRERIFMYSWSFSPDPASQRFAVIVYGQSMGLGDRKIFLDWIRTMRGEHPDFRAINIHDIRVLHCAALPGGREWVYGPYFSSWRRTRLEKDYRTGIITDSRPFRHGIRKTPFPPRYYVLYLALLGIFASVLLFSKRRDPGIFRKDGGLWGAVYFGISTFPLQYLLYYRTAARFGTSLIYYGVFLAIPLFFSALGGWISTTLKPGQFKAWIGIFLCAGGVIASINPFHYPVVLVFPLVALLFVFAGMPFPMVLQRRSGPEGRARLYAANLFSGGFAFLPWVTLHARAGWEASFGVCLAALAFGSWMLARRRAERPV